MYGNTRINVSTRGYIEYSGVTGTRVHDGRSMYGVHGYTWVYGKRKKCLGARGVINFLN